MSQILSIVFIQSICNFKQARSLRHNCIFAAHLLCLLLLAESAIAQNNSNHISTDENAVREVWLKIDHFWNERAPEDFAALFAENASFVFVDREEILEGRSAILERFSQQFPTMAPVHRHRTVIQRTHTIKPDIQIVDGRVEILRENDDGQEGPELVTTFAIVAVMGYSSQEWMIESLRVFELGADK